MSSVPPSEVIVRRLRAHGLIPRGVPVHLDRAGRNRVGCNPDGRVLWQITTCATGEPLGICSVFGARDLAAARRWRFTERDGITYVEPGDD